MERIAAWKYSLVAGAILAIPAAMCLPDRSARHSAPPAVVSPADFSDSASASGKTGAMPGSYVSYVKPSPFAPVIPKAHRRPKARAAADPPPVDVHAELPPDLPVRLPELLPDPSELPELLPDPSE